MYVNVAFVITCLYSAVSLTLVREQRFIRIIYYNYYEDSSTEQKTWQVYCFGKRPVFRLYLNESRQGFCRKWLRGKFPGKDSQQRRAVLTLSRLGLAVRRLAGIVSRRTSARSRFGCPLSSKVVLCGHCLVISSLTMNETKLAFVAACLNVGVVLVLTE